MHVWAGECHVHAGINGAELAAQAAAAPRTPSCSFTPSAAARPPRSTWPAAAAVPRGRGSRSSRPAGCSTPPGATDARQTVLVATEVGMLHQLRRAAPEIDFRAVNDRASCRYMKMITPEALLRSLRDGHGRGARRPRARRPRPRGGAADDRDRHVRRWRVTSSRRRRLGGGARRPRRRRQRRRRAHRRARRRPPPGCGSSSSPRTPRTPGRPGGPRAGSPSSSATAGDSVDAHVADTLTAGAGLCDPAAVASILTDGPAAVARLRARGAVFDATPSGRAGAHPRGRALGVPRGPRRRRRHRCRGRAGTRRGRRAAPACRS